MNNEMAPDLSGLSLRYKEAKVLYEEAVARALNTFAYQEADVAWLRLDQGGQRYSDKALNDSEIGRAVSEAWAIRAAAKAGLDAAAAGSDVKPKAPKVLPAHNILIHADGLKTVAGLTYAVGEDRLVHVEEGGIEALRVNTYNPSMLMPAEAATEEDVRPLLNHLTLLCANEPSAAGHLLNWMAWVAQNPKGKVRWAPLLVSGQGTGKDTLFKPLVSIVGRHNYVEIGPNDLESTYNPYCRQRFVVLNEMQRKERFSAYDFIKPFISGTTGDTVTINEKYKGHYPAANRMAWVVFSNHADAMPMEGDDRRFYVVEVRHPLWPNVKPNDTEKRAYFAPLHDWIENGGAALVYRYLLDRDLSEFDHANPPADTQAKHDMRRAAMSVFSQWLADECQRGLYAKRSVVCAKEVQEYAADCQQDRANGRGIKGGLEAGGFHYYGMM
ncbi:hypothetical protein JMJ56_32450, partial [Belnapia sp. T18]